MRELFLVPIVLAAQLLSPLAAHPQELLAIPNDLQPVYDAFGAANAGTKGAACDELINAYIPYLRAGKDSPSVDAALVSYLPIQSRSNVAAELAIDGIFSQFQEECLARNEAEESTVSMRELAAAARGLYNGLKDLAKAEKLAAKDWARVAAGLRGGWSYFPSPLYGAQIEEAFKKSADKRGLFEIKAYRYIDESGRKPWRYAGLFLRWLFLPEKQGFNAEISAVKQSIKTDILRTSPGVAGLPLLGGEVLTDTAGARHLLSFRDPSSELHGKRTILAFFETTCGYCVSELKSLGRLYPTYARKSGEQLSIVGIKLETNLPAVLSALAPFEKSLALPFPLLENAKSGLPAAYGVRAVPLLVFLDERGVPLWTVALRGQGHIEEKLCWFLDDLLAERSAPTQNTAASPQGRRAPMDFYYDPTSADSTKFLDQDLIQMERRYGVDLDITRHPLIGPDVSETLKDRLLALRAPVSNMPVVILGASVIQGMPSVSERLPQILGEIAQESRK